MYKRQDQNGQTRVVINPRYYRPIEVSDLLGDPTKAMNTLEWIPAISFENMIHEMVECDIEEERTFSFQLEPDNGEEE